MRFIVAFSLLKCSDFLRDVVVVIGRGRHPGRYGGGGREMMFCFLGKDKIVERVFFLGEDQVDSMGCFCAFFQ